MTTGTVKSFDAIKGFGFIAADKGGDDVFIHVSALERAGLYTVAEGQRLRDREERTERKTRS